MSIRKITAALFATATIAACGAPADDVGVDEGVNTEQVPFEDEDVLALTLDQSPSGSAELNFCIEPEGAVNLTNMAWLNFISANEYAHFGYLGPQMNELGFYDPSDTSGVDTMWDRCGVDLKAMEQFEVDHADELAAKASKSARTLRDYLAQFARPGASDWGRCARHWFEASGYNGQTYPAPAMETWLVQTARDSAHLQFFSGGKYKQGGEVFKKGSTQAMFARHSELPLAVISFRGTEVDEWSDIAADALAFQTSLAPSWGQVHDGFLKAYETVFDQIYAKVQELEGTGTKIWITGHSLGGGLATLLAAQLMDDVDLGVAHSIGGVVTFGSPRVGDATFRDRFNDLADDLGISVVRVRNQNDIVTAIPRFQEWRHAGELAYLTEGQLELGFDGYETEPGYAWAGAVAHHSIDTGYYARISPLLDDPNYAHLDVCASR